MAYNEELLTRIRKVYNRIDGLKEKKMFGGVAFMLNGNMAFGINGSDLMVRVGPEKYEEALKQKYVKEMDFTGRPMKGMVTVLSKGIKEEKNLKQWIKRGIDFAGFLPPK